MICVLDDDDGDLGKEGKGNRLISARVMSEYEKCQKWRTYVNVVFFKLVFFVAVEQTRRGIRGNLRLY